jgi:sulfur relay (sulfurtransferase) complex TusBCD TusD component (DsrE family)
VRVCSTRAEEDEECQEDVCLADLIAGTTQNSLTELSRWITEADQALVF